MEKKKIVVFGDLPIATKVVQWIGNVEELELIGCVVSKPDAHNNDPWKDTPMLKEYCEENHIKVFQNSIELKELYEAKELDLGLSCRFSKILKKDIIDLFRIGIINMHGGLLPEFGGPYSCNYSILFGEGKGGGTLHWIDENIDTGDIIRRCEFDILPDDTAYDVFQKTQCALYENLIEVILPIINGDMSDFISQQELINNGYAHRYFKLNSIEEYKEIDLNDSKENILKVVRAFDFPGYEPAYFVVEGKKIYLRMES